MATPKADQPCRTPGCSGLVRRGTSTGLCRACYVQSRPKEKASTDAEDRAAVEAARLIEPEADACRALWASVLNWALTDLATHRNGTKPLCPESFVHAVRPGFERTADFDLMCAFLGLDADSARERVAAGTVDPASMVVSSRQGGENRDGRR